MDYKNKMNILIRLPTDETISMLVNFQATTISDVSEQLQLNRNQVLVFQGEVLDQSNFTLKQIGVEN